MVKIDFIGLIVLIIVVYLCIHSFIDRICRCRERVVSMKCGVYPDNMKKTIKQTEELQESER